MGTHSYRVADTFNPDAFSSAAEQCQRFVSRQDKAAIRGWDGSGEPVFSETLISLNGAAEDAHQTFQIRLDGKGVTSCDTQYSDYDFVVRACLLILKANLGSAIEIDIDEAYPSATELARALVESYIGAMV